MIASLLTSSAALGIAAAIPARTDQPDYFAAAICEPPYSMSQATRLYKAAETLGKADTSTLGAAVYTLPSKIERDGFTASAVIFSGSSVGILLDDEVAQKAAQHFGLRSEGSHLFGASSLGFARVLPDEQQSMKELGLISVVARQGPALAGKTLLACEFVSHADREALEQYDARQR